MAKRDFSGKLVVITGAASGIGLALCRRYAAAGAKIAGIDRDEKGLKPLAEELTAKGTVVRTFTCDVTDQQQCEDTIQKIIKDMGDIDVLVNNAGISHISQFYKTKVEVLKKVIDVSLFGTIYCTHAAIESLMRTKGMIIGTSSTAGFSTLAGRTGYCAAKHGMVGFLNALRTEMIHHGVKVMLVFPSFVNTNIQNSNLNAEGKARNTDNAVTQGAIMPEEAAELIYTASVNEERQIFIGETSLQCWELTKSDPEKFDEIMLSYNKVVFEE